jgi:hypothetical protein
MIAEVAFLDLPVLSSVLSTAAVFSCLRDYLLPPGDALRLVLALLIGLVCFEFARSASSVAANGPVSGCSSNVGRRRNLASAFGADGLDAVKAVCVGICTEGDTRWNHPALKRVCITFHALFVPLVRRTDFSGSLGLVKWVMHRNPVVVPDIVFIFSLGPPSFVIGAFERLWCARDGLCGRVPK